MLSLLWWGLNIVVSGRGGSPILLTRSPSTLLRRLMQLFLTLLLLLLVLPLLLLLRGPAFAIRMFMLLMGLYCRRRKLFSSDPIIAKALSSGFRRRCPRTLTSRIIHCGCSFCLAVFCLQEVAFGLAALESRNRRSLLACRVRAASLRICMFVIHYAALSLGGMVALCTFVEQLPDTDDQDLRATTTLKKCKTFKLYLSHIHIPSTYDSRVFSTSQCFIYPSL